jgi:hypothetical protein
MIGEKFKCCLRKYLLAFFPVVASNQIFPLNMAAKVYFFIIPFYKKAGFLINPDCFMGFRKMLLTTQK